MLTYDYSFIVERYVYNYSCIQTHVQAIHI